MPVAVPAPGAAAGTSRLPPITESAGSHMARQRPLLALLLAAAAGCGTATDRVLNVAEVPPSHESAPAAATPFIFVTGTEVTIVSTTPNAIIYYTLDGTVPSNRSILYTGPFVITVPPAALVIRAIAVSAGFEESDVATESIITVGPVFEETFDVDPSWTIQTAGPGNSWQWGPNGFAPPDTYSIRYSSTTREEDSRLVTPNLVLAGADRMFLLIFDEVWRGGYQDYWSQGEVQVSTDGGSSWQRLILLHDAQPADPDETLTRQVVLDLSAYAGQTIRLGFRYRGLYDWYWVIDNLRVVGS